LAEENKKIEELKKYVCTCKAENEKQLEERQQQLDLALEQLQ
jgi:hypothetical protein